MAFITRLDTSFNRQIKQDVLTDTVYSGSNTFGVEYSSLTQSINESTTGITNTVTGVVSTFTAITTGTPITTFNFGDSDMIIASDQIDSINETNSAFTQNIGPIFTATSTGSYDGYDVITEYSGVSFDLFISAATFINPSTITGFTEELDIIKYSGDGSFYTGSTIWVNVPGKLQTERLIVTSGATPGYVLTALDSSGNTGWAPAATGGTGTGGSSLWSASTGTNSLVANNHGSIASGTNAVAYGLNTRAWGDYSHAEGNSTTASGDNSHAEGRSTTASGKQSHAEGDGTIASGAASHAEGDSTLASGAASHAEGNQTVASGRWSHSEGSLTTAIGDQSHAEGFSNIASGDSSHTEGQNTTTLAVAAHTEGSMTTASGPYSHAEGDRTIASGEASHSEGLLTTASGNHSHAEGDRTIASGETSHAEGRDTIAGDFSHAEGRDTTAIDYGHAEGHVTTSTGHASHAQNENTWAAGAYSHAGGFISAGNIVASGMTSFIHFNGGSSTGITGAIGANSAILGGSAHNTDALNSAILGGADHQIDSTAFRSIILGGSAISATSADTVYVPSLVIDGLTSVTDLQTDANGRIIDGASDINLKTNINELESPLSKVKGLRGVSFDWKPEANMGDGTYFGFIAQEVKEVIPEMVKPRVNDENHLTLDYKALVPWLVEAVKELSKENIIPKFTPIGSSDTSGKIGQITRDDDYLYVKGDDGQWKRSNLETF